MTELLGWLLAAVGGALLGLFYYAGLWFTLRRLPEQAHPALWVFGSFIVRLAVSMAGRRLPPNCWMSSSASRRCWGCRNRRRVL